MKKQITIATRNSPLALWQANWVKKKLEQKHPSLVVRLLGLTTTADRFLNTPLVDMGGKGLFVKELEEALLSEEADIAVHSMKDVPMILPKGLCVPVICEREDPRDVLIALESMTLQTLPAHAKLGSSSLRRQSQLCALRSDIEWISLRGNVNTRLERLESGEFTALILAAAGLKRLGLKDIIKQWISVEEMLPAAGQGALGIECREDDHVTLSLITFLNHAPTFHCVTAERAMCRLLEGGCRLPVAAYAEQKEDQLYLRGVVAKPDGSQILRTEQIGVFEKAGPLGEKAAKVLIQQGALKILAEIQS